jgi:hypothetical protein
VLENLRPGSRRLLAGVTVASGTLLAAACGSSSRGASDAGGTPSPVTAQSSGPITTAAPAATTALDSVLAPGPTAAPPPTAASASTGCGARAHTFLHVTAARAAADGSLTLTASPARLVCGARGDSHFTVTRATVTAHVIRGASITVFPVSGTRPEPITPTRLPAYLASDQDTRTFLVTGPLSAISGLHEQFRP